MKQHDGTRDSEKGGESSQNEERWPGESGAVISPPEPEIRMGAKTGNTDKPAEFAFTLPAGAQHESLFGTVTDAELMQLI